MAQSGRGDPEAPLRRPEMKQIGAPSPCAGTEETSMDPLLAAACLGAALCFSLGLVLAQFGLRSVPPLTGACVSIPTTAALFLAISPFSVDWAGWAAPGGGRAAAIFASAGLVYPVAVTLLTFWSGRRLGPHLTGALGNLAPLFAVLGAALLLDERPSPAQALGLLAICAGVGALYLGRRGAGAGLGAPLWVWAAPLGAALLRGAAQPWAGLGLRDWADPFAAATLGYLVSTIAVLAAGGLGGALGPAVRRAARDWPWFAAVGLANGAAVLLLYVALSMGPVSLVAPLVACHPLITLALNRILGGERGLPPGVALGVAATVAGAALLLAA